MAQTAEQYNAIIALCKANDLQPEQLWQHKQSGHWIISRNGIEKIVAKNQITVALAVVGCGIDWAVVKATAALPRKSGVMYPDAPVPVESLGSAQPGNVSSKFTYFAEMAEKRAKGRAVLMLMGFYALGVYGEDEAPTFAKEENKMPQVAAAVPAIVVVKDTPAAPVQYATAAQKEEIIRLLNNIVIQQPERTKVLLNINRLDEERADQMISNLRTSIDERGNAK